MKCLACNKTFDISYNVGENGFCDIRYCPFCGTTIKLAKDKIESIKEKISNTYGQDNPLGTQHLDHNKRFFQPK